MNPEETGTLEIRQYLSLLRRWLWLILLATALAAASAYVASRLSTPIYEATSTLLISEGQKPGGTDYNTILMSERLAKTYAQRLKERPVLKEAAARLRLPGEGDEPQPTCHPAILRLNGARPLDRAAGQAVSGPRLTAENAEGHRRHYEWDERPRRAA